MTFVKENISKDNIRNEGRHAGLSDYISIARLDHASKHVFVLPGIALAFLLRGVRVDNLLTTIILGFLTAIFIASANYVINEWLDREFDRHHPTKSKRAAVQKTFKASYIYTWWVFLIAMGLFCAWSANTMMFLVAILFAGQGVVYNIPPIRTKDKAYLDVISEAINNPFRLMIGWAMVDPTSLPPSSIILAYWLGGAFLMAVKRYSEYRQIVQSHGRDLLVRYRASFKDYTDDSLLVSCFVYALLGTFAATVFLVKYRIEYVLLIPIVVAMFAQYLHMSMSTDSAAQKPEELFREKKLIGLVMILAISFIALTVIDLPALETLTSQQFISTGLK